MGICFLLSWTWICLMSFCVDIIDGNVCPPNMKFHKHTRTCMILEKKAKYYSGAESYCETTYTGGHLVYILDKETDDFIKNSLLDSFDYGYIGLRYTSNGRYKWGREIDATYFGWQYQPHTPSNSYTFVYIEKLGWRTTKSENFPFICQSSTVRNEFLLMNDSNVDNETLDTDSNTKTLITCLTTRNRGYSLQLIFYNNTGGSDILPTDTGQEINYSLLTTCSSSGQYVCRITYSSPSTVVELKLTLRVRCLAAYCSTAPKFVVTAIGTEDVTQKVCVHVYPPPKDLKIIKSLSLAGTDNDTQPLSTRRYKIDFQYISDGSTIGELEIKIMKLSHSDIGRYFVRVFQPNQRPYRLYFDITGPPVCPESITSKHVSSDTVTLTWSPIPHVETKQTFIVMRQAVDNDVRLATVAQEREQQQMTYNLTGLSPIVNYTVYINVANEHGETDCRHMKIFISTRGVNSEGDLSIQSVNDSKSDNKTAVIVPLVLLLVIIVIVVIVAVAVRRRRSRRSSSQKSIDRKRLTELSTEISQYYEIELDATKNNIPMNSEMAENVYNNVLENKVNKIVKITKPPRKSTSSSVKFKDKVCMETGQSKNLEDGKDTSLLAVENLSDTKEDTEEGHVYANTHTAPSTQGQSDKDPDVMTTVTASTKKDDGRTVSPQGLVYVSVEIGPDNRTPQLVDAEKEKITEEKKVYEPVEYTTLDYLATSEAETLDKSGENVNEEL